MTLPSTILRYGRLDEAVLVDAGKGRERVDQADVRAFRRLDRADTAVVGRVHVADFEAGTLAGQTARPKRRETTLVRDLGERVGLVHELAEAGDEPKNSRTAAAAGLALIRSCGMTVSISTDDMRSLIARSMRSRPSR